MSEQDLQILAIPAFSDNYIWLLRGAGKACAVVDPGDAAPVLEVLRANELDLKYILLTHHHWDHADGIPELLQHYDAQVFGPDDRRLGDWCQPCHENERVKLPALGLEFDVLDIPAHTRSHIAFHGHGMVFSGDTLFRIGCGRLFEGSAEDMQAAMDKLATLPPETEVYCGHEYTVSNCQFALNIEPDNIDLKRISDQALASRAAGEITLPSTIADELAANPFMRTRQPAVVHAAQQRQRSAVAGTSTMAVIRTWKDAF